MTDAAGTALLDQVVMEAWWLGGPAVASVYDTVQTAEGSWVAPACSSSGVRPEADGWASGLEVRSGSMLLPMLVSGLSRREVEGLFKEVPGRPSLTSELVAITSSPAWYRW